MTTIMRRPDLSRAIDMTSTLKVGQISADEKAKLAKREAEQTALAVETAKQRAAIEKSNHYENHAVMFSAPEKATPENAKKALDLLNSMIRDGETSGLTFSGGWNGKVATDVKTYMSWLQECIATGTPNAPLADGAGTSEEITK
jgi:hypothetical protein